MTTIFYRKLKTLVVGEEGVALVVTLALFMLLYVACAGVFAVGRTVRDKVILQNACDAAAYSAAVVQADTLSRVSAINRAMAWTYKSMVCRQMDYVTLRWLEETEKAYKSDIGKGVLSNIDIGKTESNVLLERLSGKLDGYQSAISEDSSFYASAGDLKEQIKADKANLNQMSATVESLMGDLEERMYDAARAMLIANLPREMPSHLAERAIFLCKIREKAEWLKQLKAGDEDRANLLKLGNKPTDLGEGIDLSVFELSTHQWLKPFAGSMAYYFDDSEGNLVCRWWLNEMPRQKTAKEAIGDDETVTEYAEMLATRDLRNEYFSIDGSAALGAVTVAVAVRNENPWREILGLSGVEGVGLHAVFNPARAAEWTHVFSSAIAAYPTGDNLHDYTLVGKSQRHLNESEWEPVLLPVRHALTKEEFADVSLKSSRDWQQLNEDSSLVAVDDYKTYREGGADRLPLMHDGDVRLDWERLFDGVYH